MFVGVDVTAWHGHECGCVGPAILWSSAYFSFAAQKYATHFSI